MNNEAKYLTINLTAAQGAVLAEQYVRVVKKEKCINASFAFELQRGSCREILGAKIRKYNADIQLVSPTVIVPIRVTYIQFLWLIEVANYWETINENFNPKTDLRASILLAAKHASERHFRFKYALKKEPYYGTLCGD
ncbi:hypothetical protein [Flexibacter flexilis]|nr:hypothetical protein [Flexibacter flexilis]